MPLRRLLAVAAAVLIVGGTAAQAAPIAYEGTLTTNTPVTGLVSGFSFFDADAPDSRSCAKRLARVRDKLQGTV